MSDPRDPMGLMEMLRRQEGRTQPGLRSMYEDMHGNMRLPARPDVPLMLDKELEQTAREDALASPVVDDVRLRALGFRHQMGESVALDRYGVQPGIVGRPLNAVDRVLRQVGPGVPENEVRSYNRFPDAASERQRPPPAPPFFDENTPAWATEQQGTPEFWSQPGVYADDPERGYDI